MSIGHYAGWLMLNGKALTRDEDVRRLQGRCGYVANVYLPVAAFVALVDSAHAHASANVSAAIERTLVK